MAIGKRSLGGRKAHTNGSAFEGIIDMACRAYAAAGAAFIEKTPEHTRILKNLGSGRFEAVFVGAAQPDYKGTIRGGRAVVFEAKHTEGSRIERARLTDKQMEALDRHAALGAWCFVLVSFGMQSFYRVPWEVWRDMPEIFGKVSVNERDLKDYLTPLFSFLDEGLMRQG
jgi:recombination protein U